MTPPEPKWMPKLYLVSRADLPPGVQACQAMHAMREFGAKFPEIELEWYLNSNYIAFLEAEDKETLEFYIDEANARGIAYADFYEPDLENDLTSVAFAPTLISRELLACLPTALKTNNKKKRNGWF